MCGAIKPLWQGIILLIAYHQEGGSHGACDPCQSTLEHTQIDGESSTPFYSGDLITDPPPSPYPNQIRLGPCIPSIRRRQDKAIQFKQWNLSWNHECMPPSDVIGRGVTTIKYGSSIGKHSQMSNFLESLIP